MDFSRSPLCAIKAVVVLVFLSPDRNIFFSSCCVGTRSSLSVGVSSDPCILICLLMIIPLYASHDFMALMFDFM